MGCQVIKVKDAQENTPAQPVTVIPIAIDTLAVPETFPMTVGTVVKKPPFAIPLMITKITSGPMEADTGQRISVLKALSKKDKK